jgi:hypothetical protein
VTLSIFQLALPAKESPPLRFAAIFFNQRNLTSGASYFCVREPVLFQHEFLFPFQEIIAVVVHFPDQFRQFTGRNVPDPGFRMQPDPVQHFIFKDIPRT